MRSSSDPEKRKDIEKANKVCLTAILTFIIGLPRGLPRVQNRWGFQRGEAVALPFGRTRGFKSRVRYNLIVDDFIQDTYPSTS